MSIAAGATPPRRSLPAFLTLGFRPFFLAAGLWAAVALAVWIVMLTAGTALPSRFDPLSWHIHEMLFGFVMAAIAGFLLTAIPNWTGRPPVTGIPLGLLAGLWLLGRIACLISALLPTWLAIVADLSFPAALVAVIAREIVAGRNWRNLAIVAPVTVLGIANLLMHLEANGMAVPKGLGWRVALAAILILISVIAGRIVPSFTRNWLTQRGTKLLPAPPGLVDRFSLGALHAGLLGWALLPGFSQIGWLLLLAAIMNGWRLFRWRGGSTAKEPLLIALHIGYGWLVVGTALLGLAGIGTAVPESAAIHAITVGAFGTMILAVMTRAIRGHTGRALAADRATTAIYLLVTLAAATRVAAAVATVWAMPLLVVSAVLWIVAFSAFLLGYGPMLLHSRRPM